MPLLYHAIPADGRSDRFGRGRVASSGNARAAIRSPLYRSVSHDNLAVSLMARFEHTGRPVNLNEAIVPFGQGLELRPVPHPDRPASLSTVASSPFQAIQADVKHLPLRLGRGGLVVSPDARAAFLQPFRTINFTQQPRFRSRYPIGCRRTCLVTRRWRC
ncbi:hypothetical protein EW146_g8130 [Bondarzewia mesenterica]|uniref:Uncharacterized protein n=1 Tax=Bondarzewia mesenterica TaxID=1095465 RepID=A0A4S4LGV4_9AGAM|nr:hypothetical protein EW146_g8130 [Bondarzewia mesenterica]